MEWENKASLYCNKVNINTRHYQTLFKKCLLPDCGYLYSDRNCVFQQDGATSHTSRTMSAYLDQSVEELIKD